MATADPKKKKKKRKKKESLEHKRNRILVALGIFAVVYALDELGTLTAAFGTPGDIYASFVLFLVPFLIAGYDVLQKAFNNIRRGKAFDESFLMAVATIGAFAMVLFPDTDPHMAEGAAVMLFYQVGELFQAYAVGKSRKSISAMMDIAPDYANVEQPDGTLEQVFPDDIAVGTVIVVKPGERVPIDGVIVEGETQLDTAALTGESIPRPAKSGDDIISGCINMTGLITCAPPSPLASPPSHASWSSWKMPAKRRRAPRTLSRASPASTRPPSPALPRYSRSAAAWSPAPGPTGSCAA